MWVHVYANTHLKKVDVNSVLALHTHMHINTHSLSVIAE